MSDYSSKKVAELKELLSARGLAVSGNKADLVARLEENDKVAGDKPAAEEEKTTTDDAAKADAEKDAAAKAEAAAAADAATEVIEVSETDKPAATVEAITVEDEEPVVEISDEDKAKQAVEDLEKQIKRKKRFATGDNDADIADLEKQLDRIKKFGASAAVSNGLSLDTGLSTLKKERRREGGKVRRESVTAKDKNVHPYKKEQNGLKPGVKIATVDDEKIKARQARFSQ